MTTIIIGNDLIATIARLEAECAVPGFAGVLNGARGRLHPDFLPRAPDSDYFYYSLATTTTYLESAISAATVSTSSSEIGSIA